MRCGSSARPATRWPTARSAKCWCMRPRPARATGTSATRAARPSRATGPAPATNMSRDGEGRYTFCGRSDDMFKVSGIWVSPFEVESALITHPAVLEAAVVPEADPDGLLKPKAFVVLRPGSATDRPARGAEGSRQAEDRAVEISALGRGGRCLAENRDRQDPALQAAGGGELGMASSFRGAAQQRTRNPRAAIPIIEIPDQFASRTVRNDDLDMKASHDPSLPQRLPHHRRRQPRIPHDRSRARPGADHRAAA